MQHVYLLVNADYEGLGIVAAFDSKREALKAMLAAKRDDVRDRLETQRMYSWSDRDFYRGGCCYGEFKVLTMQVHSAA